MIRAALALAATALLAACATPPAPPPAGAGQQLWPAHRAAAEALSEWEVEGRVSVRTGQQGASATLNWHQHPDHSRLQAVGPLGAGAFTLERNPDGAVLRTADGRVRTAPQVEALVLDAFGADVPVRALGYWIRGVPAPGPVQALTVDAHGRLGTLTQDGWVLAFTHYTTSTQPPLPTRLRAQREDTEVRLAIRTWRLDAPD